MKIASNDPDAPSFDIALTGGSSAKSAAIAKSTSISKSIAVAANEKPAKPVKSIVRIGGEKFRCITFTKSAARAISSRDIEVSGNLTDWSSGARHTTVLQDNPEILQVRDNVPLTPGNKRFIRLKTRH